jgi:hypothetical protein
MILVVNGAPAMAQIPTPGPPGPYVIDVRGTASGVPAALAFFPPLSTSTLVPARGFGLDLGAHVFVKSLGAARLGVGLNLLRVGSRADTVVVSSSSGTTSTGTSTSTGASSSATGQTATNGPRVDVTLLALAPQVSLNFGKANGWSYVSAGLGSVSVSTRLTTPSATGTTIATQDNGATRALNVGGGARWFTSSHLAIGFDVRFHQVAAGDTTPSTILVSTSVGISLR